MKEAFTYMFKDNKIIQKAVMYFCFSVVAMLCSDFAKYFTNQDTSKMPAFAVLLLIVLSVVFGFITSGYSIMCNRAVIEQKENIVLPFVNVGGNLFTGFKFGISIFMLILSLMAIMIPFAVISVLVSPWVVNIYTILAIILIICFAPALTYIFAKTDSWFAFFKFKDAFQMIKFSGWQYWKSLLVLSCLGIFNALIFTALSYVLGINVSSIVITSVLACILGSYLVYVYAYIVANCIKE